MLTKVSLLWILLCVVGGALSQDRPLEAWLRVEFPATETSYQGVDISALEPRWQKIGVLSYGVLPSDANDDIGWMRKEGFAFVKEGNLGAKGFVDRAVVGVFKDRSGNGGRFLLVLRKEPSGAWKKLFLHQEPGERGFSVLVARGGKLYWGTCMQCENFRRLVVIDKGAILN